jgi:hypothetical protein
MCACGKSSIMPPPFDHRESEPHFENSRLLSGHAFRSYVIGFERRTTTLPAVKKRVRSHFRTPYAQCGGEMVLAGTSGPEDHQVLFSFTNAIDESTTSDRAGGSLTL